MSDFTQANVDETVLSAWRMAEEACFHHLVYITSSIAGKNCAIGDNPSYGNKVNIWNFMISGSSVDQSQNWQCTAPGKRYLVDAELYGVYRKRAEALFVGGQVINGLPAYEKDSEDEVETALSHRGLNPNCDFFELTTFPECISDGDNWVLRIQFRVAFTDSEN